MTWNYRILKNKLTVDIVKDEVTGEVIYSHSEDKYGIIECYYNDKGEITSTTENFIEPYGETLEDLKWCFEKMQEAFDKEVLDVNMQKVYVEVN